MTSPYQPLKVYLAAPFEDREEMLLLKAALEARGCVVTSTWLTPADGNDNNMATLENKYNECRTRAIKDVEDIMLADILVLRKPKEKHKVPTTGGHHNETGICIGSGKPFVVYGARENVFHYHPMCVAVVDTFGELCDYLHIPRNVA